MSRQFAHRAGVLLIGVAFGPSIATRLLVRNAGRLQPEGAAPHIEMPGQAGVQLGPRVPEPSPQKQRVFDDHTCREIRPGERSVVGFHIAAANVGDVILAATYAHEAGISVDQLATRGRRT